MSQCSSCVVAGRTMSAQSAVSVWKCSSTTVKRSDLPKPRTTVFLSGATAAGFEL
ncbi:hypothetical protein D3C83_56390 [compost metagenome]